LEVPRDGFVVIDGRKTDFIDPDVLSLLRDFQNITAPARGIRVSLQGFRERYDPAGEIQTIDYSQTELRGQLTPDDVLRLLLEGNQRFRAGVLTRGESRQNSAGEPYAQNSCVTILSCIDCYMPVESIFDLRPDNICSVQVAGNVIDTEVVNNLEY
ncbi:MAG: sulfate transporter, partial [Gimesia chilikensis]